MRFQSDNMAVVEILKKQGPLAHALAALSAFPFSIFRLLFCFRAHSRGLKHSCRRNFTQQFTALRSTDPPSVRPSVGGRSAHFQEAGLGLTGMDQSVLSLFNDGIAPSTRSSYESGWRSYLGFCAAFSLPLLPAAEISLCQFAVHLSTSISYQTIRSYLSAIRFFKIRAGLPDLSFLSELYTC